MKKENSIISNVIWKFCERFLARIVSFVVSIFLARMLSVDDYGIISMVMIFITIADVFVSSGFSTGLIQKKDADSVDFSTMFICSFLCSIALYGVLYMCAPFIAVYFHMDKLIVVIRIFALKIPISAYNSIQHAYVSRNMLFKKFFWSTLLGTIISGVVGIIMAYKGFGVWALVAQYFTNTIIDSVVLTFTIKWKPQFVFSRKNARPLMSYGIKVLFADLSGVFFGQLRNLLIGRKFSSTDLAFYNRGQQFPALITDNVTTSVISVMFPALSNHSDDKKIVKELIRKSISMIAFVVFPMIFGLIAISKQLIIVLLTEKWLDCVIYLQLISFSSLIGLIGDISLQVVKAIGRSDVLLKLEFIKKPLFVILLFIGMKYGVLGIAVTGVIYNIYATCINAYQLKKYIEYSFKEQFVDVANSLFASLVMFGTVYIIGKIPAYSVIVLIVQTIVGVILYVSISFITKNKMFMYLIEKLSKMIKRGK